MKKLSFSIDINAPKDKVWYSLWDDENYADWTSAFCEGSNIVTDFEEGSKIYFMDPNGSGMNSKVTIKKPFDVMSFNHYGELKDWEELPQSEITKSWSGSEERYDLTEKDGITTVNVTVDIVESHEGYFQEAFPKALDKLKEIAESPTKSITVKTSTKEPLEKAWDYFTNPKHIVNWCFASDDWHCPKADNDLRVGGTFSSTMASKDGKISFDFGGTYTEAEPMKKYAYTMTDGRKVTVKFHVIDGQTIITENFEPENSNPEAMQRDGWQAIMDNYKKYLEE